MRSFGKDSYLFREGDPGSHLYLVVQGEVKIARVTESGGEIVFAVVGHGGVIGELSVFDEDGERSTDAVALVPTECLALPRQAVVEFFLDLFLQGDVPAETKERLELYLMQAHKQTLPVYWTADDRDRHPTRALCHLVLTLPEFQLN